MDKKTDLIIIGAIIAFGLWFLYQANSIGIQARQIQMPEPLGTDGMPRLLAVLITMLGIILLATKLWAYRKVPGPVVEAEGEEDTPGFPISNLRVFFLAVLVASYFWAMEWISYVVATPLFIAAGLTLLGLRELRWLTTVSLGFTVVIYLSFTLLFSISLPMGLLADLQFQLFKK